MFGLSGKSVSKKGAKKLQIPIIHVVPTQPNLTSTPTNLTSFIYIDRHRYSNNCFQLIGLKHKNAFNCHKIKDKIQVKSH